MSQGKRTAEQDARERATHTLADGKPIMEKALLLRCADRIDFLRAALDDIAAQAQKQGGIWARRRAEEALERED